MNVISLRKPYRITAIISLYNKVDHLENRLKFMSFYEPGLVRYIVIDHASTDGSSEIAQKFCREHEHFDYVLTHNNTHNPSEPRNVGLKMADTDYVVIVDADDVFCADEAVEAVKYLDENPNCAAVCGMFCNSYEFIYNDRPEGLYTLWEEAPIHSEYGNVYDAIFGVFYIGTGSILRRSKIKYPYRNEMLEDSLFGLEFMYGLEHHEYFYQMMKCIYIQNQPYSERNKEAEDELRRTETFWLNATRKNMLKYHPDFEKMLKLNPNLNINEKWTY